VGLVNSTQNPFTEYANNTEFTQVYNAGGVSIYKLVS